MSQSQDPVESNNGSKKKEKKHKKKKNKRKSSDTDYNNDNGDIDASLNDDDDKISMKGEKKKRKKEKKRRSNSIEKEEPRKKKSKISSCSNHFPFEYQHIVAPMVGASELAFRLLCRKYGATLSYTPMMSSSQFIKEAEAKGLNTTHTNGNCGSGSALTIANSDICEFQTIPQDRPLVCHFSANTPQDFATAAKLVEYHCDAIDLNLGCPQRTAYLGHFGSYLLGENDRELVLDIIRAGSGAVSIPIFVKIRLLDTVEESIMLCKQLRDAGASLIAIHARYRASWERIGPGARDGPAMLDKLAVIKREMGDFPIVSNGNVITYEDVVSNIKETNANGIMSAEGILDNPSLYLPRLGDVDKDGEREIKVPVPSALRISSSVSANGSSDKKKGKSVRKLQKKLREIGSIEKKVKESGEESINDDQRSKLKAKTKILKELWSEKSKPEPSKIEHPGKAQAQSQTKTVKLSKLFEVANNKIALAREYLTLVRSYPMKIRSVVFHTRRMCRDLLEKYQLMAECIASTSIDEVDAVLTKCERYVNHPETFKFDQQKAARDKAALVKKRQEEKKRKAYEGRMMRKAKREGKDVEHYLRIGAEVPTIEIVRKLKVLPKEERLVVWKKDHSQHCMSYHLEDGGCKRDRACAFMHVEAKDKNKFLADDEVAG